MAGSSDVGSGNSRAQARALWLVCILTLLAALTAAGPVAQACEESLQRNGGPTPSALDSGCLDRQYKAPLFPPATLLPAHSGEDAAPFHGAGFFALHEPEHKPPEESPGGEEDDEEVEEGTTVWFGAEVVLMLLGAGGDDDVSGEEDGDFEPSEAADDGVMFGLNLSFGFGERESYGLGLMVERGILVADLSVFGSDDLITVGGEYTIAGPTLRFGGKKGSGSVDFLFGDMNDPQVSSITNFRFNLRAGVGPVSSGFYIGLSIGLLYIGFDEDVDSYFSGNLNILWGLVLGGQF